MCLPLAQVAGVEGRCPLRAARAQYQFPVEQRKVKGLPEGQPVAALVVDAVALHVLKVVLAPHAEEQPDGVTKKILAPLVHPGYFAQHCIDESCTHSVIVLCSSCGKLKLRIFTLFNAQNFHGLLIVTMALK